MVSKKKNKEADDKYNRVANILAAAGVSSLGEKPHADAVFRVLDRLGHIMYGENDKLFRAMVEDTVIGIFRLGQYGVSPAKLVAAALKSTPKRTEEGEYITHGPTSDGRVIIDMVQRGPKLEWVVVKPGTGRVTLVGEEPFSPSDKVAGKMMWPRCRLPWKGIPKAEDVEEALANGAEAPFMELYEMFKRRVTLPDPQGGYAVMLAAWVLGTYRLDEFTYFPELLIQGKAVRGKTRLGDACIFTAFRGIEMAGITSAVIFRYRTWHGVGLFLDETNLPKTLDKDVDKENLILHAFERGGTVARVTRLDAPPPDQIEDFVAYGPTILSSNNPIKDDSPLMTRCIQVPMPEARERDVPDHLLADERLALQLRAKCVAWAAHAVARGEVLPPHQRVFKGRLHDLATPLLRVLLAVRPEATRGLIKMLRGRELVQKKELIGTLDARVADALWECREKVKGDELANVIVQEYLNKNASEGEEVTSQQIGYARRRLGLSGTKGGARGTAHITWPGDDQIKAIRDRYVI